jgi:hypothetical protein
VVVAIRVDPLYTLYPDTPLLSVEAVHERLICDDEAAVAVKPVGVDGGVVSVEGVEGEAVDPEYSYAPISGAPTIGFPSAS